MKDNVREQFEKFSATMAGASYDLLDVLDLITGFASSGMPQVGFALAEHMKDYLREPHVGQREEGVPYSAVIVEAYRRAFCDPETAARHGTEELANNPDAMAGLLEQTTKGMQELYASSNPAQYALTIEADTSHAH